MFLRFWRKAEINASDYLRRQGYRVVASGFRVREGEVDIIAWDGDVLVFVEVKSRKTEDAPESAVGMRKRRRVVKAAKIYMSRYKLNDVCYRFDIIAVNEVSGRKTAFRLFRDAFSASA